MPLCRISLAILLTLIVLPQASARAQLQMRETAAPVDIRYRDPGKLGFTWLEGMLIGDRWLNFIDYGREPLLHLSPANDDRITKFVCVLSLKTGEARWFVPSEVGGKAVHLHTAFPIDASRLAVAYRLDNETTFQNCIWNLETLSAENFTPPAFYAYASSAWIKDLPESFANSYSTYDDAIKQLQMRLRSSAGRLGITPALQQNTAECFYLIPTLQPPVPLVDTGGHEGPQVVFFSHDLTTPSPDVVTSKQVEEACQQKDCNFLLPARSSPYRATAIYLAARFGDSTLYGVRIKDKKITNVYALAQPLDDLYYHTVSPSGQFHAYSFKKNATPEGDQVQIFDYHTQKLSSHSFDDGEFLGILDNGEIVRNILHSEENVVIRTYRLTSEGTWQTAMEFHLPQSDRKEDAVAEQP